MLGIVHGFWDSVKGVALVFYIDVEIYKQKVELEAERKARLEQQEKMLKRSSSPTPSSATAMANDEMNNKTLSNRTNSDERSVESLKWTTKSTKSCISVPFK